MNRSKRHDSESGVVAVMGAIFMLVLCTFIGLAIDVGNWYLQATRMQQAVDAAALSGVARMPNVELATATATATLSRNGIVQGGSVTVEMVALSDTQLQLKATNTEVPTLFASFVMDHITISRSATAEWRRTVKLGNPYNALGMGQKTNVAYTDMNYQGYHLAINGHCTAAEDGDLHASFYDGNKGDALGTYPSVCDGSRGERNFSYKPITNLDGGYNFIIKIPADAVGQSVRLYDPAYGPGTYKNDEYSPDRSMSAKLDPTSHITTTYRLFSTPGITEDDVNDDVLLYSRTFETDYGSGVGTAGKYTNSYTTLNSAALGPGTYRLNVTTPDDGLGRSYGVNAFGVRVSPPSSHFPVGNVICDSRKYPTWCPHLYAVDAFSIQTTGEGKHAKIHLAQLDPSYAGHAFQVGLFDPGEASKRLQLARPDGACSRFAWSTPSKGGTPSMSGSASGGHCYDTDETSLDVSGTSPLIPGRQSDAKFNDRMVTLETSLPLNYQEVVDAAGGNTWWQIRYRSLDGQDGTRDRTTWSVDVDDGTPVRLVNK